MNPEHWLPSSAQCSEEQQPQMNPRDAVPSTSSIHSPPDIPVYQRHPAPSVCLGPNTATWTAGHVTYSGSNITEHSMLFGFDSPSTSQQQQQMPYIAHQSMNPMDSVPSTSSHHGPLDQPVYQQHSAPSVFLGPNTATGRADDAPYSSSDNPEHSMLFGFDLPSTTLQQEDTGYIEHQSMNPMDAVPSTSSLHGPLHQPVYQQHPAPSVCLGPNTATGRAGDARYSGCDNPEHNMLFDFHFQSTSQQQQDMGYIEHQSMNPMDTVPSTSSRHGPLDQPIYQQHPEPSVCLGPNTATGRAGDAPYSGSDNPEHSTLFGFDFPSTSQQQQDMGYIENQSTALARDYKCHIPECSKTFSKPSQLTDHINQHKGIKPYRCQWPVCDKRFSNKNYLNQHFRAHIEESMYVCNVCSRRFNRGSYLKSHMKIHGDNDNGKTFICSWRACGREFANSGDLKKHIRTHTGDRPYMCDVCNRRFATSSNLHQHITIHNKKTFDCTLQDCGKQFKRLEQLKFHIRIHTGERPYECEVCNKRFTHSGTLRKHSKIHNNKIFACSFQDCAKQFTHSHNLKVHIRTHTGECPYGCEVCNKRFTQSWTLSRHMRIHGKKKTFVCSFQDCGKQFRQMENLKVHIRTHTGERPFECKICNKRFKQSCTLSRHMRIHGKKTFVCSFEDCGKQFRQMENLKVHIRTHTGERPYECAVCKKRFTVSGNLSRHMKRLHTEKEKVAKRTVE